MEDHRIIDLYWQRDESAITETDSKYGSFCHRLAMNILHSFSTRRIFSFPVPWVRVDVPTFTTILMALAPYVIGFADSIAQTRVN